MTETKHIGRKIGRLREIRGWKQQALADALGISQQAVSSIEQSAEIEETTLERVAKALGFSADTIKNFDEDKALYYIQNNYDGSNPNATNVNTVNTSAPYNYGTINFADKLIEALDANKKLVDKNESLYQALLKEKDEKIALLQNMLEGKK